ncbi:MAG: pilus assembly protein TadG-related protein [Desulfobacterales bacterium]|nr:hypothetical protein [Pseudomonadota bacterium]MBU4356270.1 hypothetical protein [Pseudomonadota bacterium]MCG2771350.1 pilus assembly protein TadG-related protein [Desulfobacterales bacterium]
MHNTRAHKNLTLALDESGASAVIVAIVLTVICGFVGLAFDVGHMVMVKAELQRTADAGALAGAAGLAPYNNPGPNETPNWVQGQLRAQALVNNAYNKANYQQFSIPVDAVKPGYWCLTPPTDYVQSPPSPPLPTVCPINSAYLPLPAITMTLSRDVTLYLAPIFGISNPKTMSATATAILPKCYSTTNIPPIALDPDTVFDIGPDATIFIDLSDQDIQPFSNKGKASWFNLDGTNDVPTVRINRPLTTMDDRLWMVPGTDATLLRTFVHVGDTIIMPVVENVEKCTYQKIVDWVAFKVEQADANSMKGKFLPLYFDPNVIPTAGTPTLPSGVMGTPKLVSP